MRRKSINQSWQSVKGKIAVVIMSFSGDKQCLLQCLRGLEEQKKKGYDLEVFVLDDNEHPLDLSEEELKHFTYRKTFFPRNKNLNGSQCALGMLMEMVRCARSCKAEYLMKVDCDMYIRTIERFIEVLENEPQSVIGFQLRPTMNYAAGVTYILPAQGLYNTVKNFYKWLEHEKKGNEQFIPHIPEDWAISRSVAWVNKYKLLLWDNFTNSEQWLMAPFNFQELNEDGSVNSLILSKFCMYDFVNFGNRYDITKECKCGKLLDQKSPRDIAGETMQKFIDFDLNNEYNTTNTTP